MNDTDTRLAETRALIKDADENGFDWADYEAPDCNCDGICASCEHPKNPLDVDFYPHAKWLLDQLEQARAELTAVEEARQAWAKTAQEQLADVKAERDRLAEAVQRVRACHEKIVHWPSGNRTPGPEDETCMDCDGQWPCATTTALDGEGSDVDSE